MKKQKSEKKEKVNVNSVIELILTKRAQQGEKVTVQDVMKIKNFIAEDILKVQNISRLGDETIDLLRYFQFTPPEVMRMTKRNNINNYNGGSLVGATAVEAIKKMDELYQAFAKCYYITIDKRENNLTYNEFTQFVKNYWFGTLAVNAITGEIEFIDMPEIDKSDIEAVNLTHFVSTSCLYLSAVYNHITEDRIREYSIVMAQQNTFNPVLEMLNNNRWDGVSRLPLVYDCLQLQDKTLKNLVNKWLIQCVALLHNTQHDNLGAATCLTLVGPTGVGKSRFLRELCPDYSWFKSIESFDPSDKDKVRKATTTWIGELAEVGSLYKRDQEALKAFLTESLDNYRLPYEKNMRKVPRIASYGATVNKAEFLADDASRRWLVLQVENEIPSTKLEELHRESVQLWCEVHELYKANPKGYFLTYEENQVNVLRNNTMFSRRLPFQDELEELYIFEDGNEKIELKQAWSEVCEKNGYCHNDASKKRDCFNTFKALCNKHRIKVKNNGHVLCACIKRVGKESTVDEVDDGKWHNVSEEENDDFLSEAPDYKQD